MDVKDIVVVVPIYLPVLSETDAIALKQCFNILKRYDIVAVKPCSLDLSSVLSAYHFVRVVEFPDECFAGIRGYNKLVLSEQFYRSFSGYAYMLIYQLDAYVFRDELLDWARKGYDYIGAPWIPTNEMYFTWSNRLYRLWGRMCFRLFNRKRLYEVDYHYFQVGNGGLCLRKISKMIEITAHYKEKIARELADDKPFLPEDVFLYADLDDRGYRLSRPSCREAMKFSMEQNPALTYQWNKNRLPFGCHNWMHELMYPFWKQFIK